MFKFTSFYFDITYLDLMHYTNAHNYGYKNIKNRVLEILIFQLHVLIFIYAQVNL